MDIEKEFLDIVIKARERGLRIGQLFDNIRSLLRFIEIDIFFLDDKKFLEAANRFLNGDHHNWQIEELRAQIIKLDREIELLKEKNENKKTAKET